MIGFLRGILWLKQTSAVILDVNGVGYEVTVPLSVFCHLPAEGKEVFLLTHFHVREDGQQLFGFISEDERLMFRTLLKVNGVGPKLALAILSSMEPWSLVSAIQNNEIDLLVRLPGVGKKTAERLVVEMRDRLKEWSGLATMSEEKTEVDMQALVANPIQEAIAALVALGYKSVEASRMISAVQKTGANTLEELVRGALRLQTQN